jgi:hypothetical protein
MAGREGQPGDAEAQRGVVECTLQQVKAVGQRRLGLLLAQEFEPELIRFRVVGPQPAPAIEERSGLRLVIRLDVAAGQGAKYLDIVRGGGQGSQKRRRGGLEVASARLFEGLAAHVAAPQPPTHDHQRQEQHQTDNEHRPARRRRPLSGVCPVAIQSRSRC